MMNYFLVVGGVVVGLILFVYAVWITRNQETANVELRGLSQDVESLRARLGNFETELARQCGETSRQLSREIEETSNGVAANLKQLVLSTELRDVMQSVYDNAVADGRLPQRYEKTELDTGSTSAAYAHELLTIRVVLLDECTEVRFGHAVRDGDDIVWRPASTKEKRFADWLAVRISEMDHKAIRAMFDNAALKRMIKLWYYRNMKLDSRENTTRFFRASTALLMHHFSEYEVVEKE